MTKSLIIDGWNLFSYDGIPNDTEDKKTVAIKQLGENCAEIILDVKTMRFHFIKNGELWFDSTRFSSALRMADEWFKNMEK